VLKEILLSYIVIISARSAFKKLGDASVRFDSIVNTIGKVSDGFKFLAGKRVSDYNPKGGNVPQPPLKKSRYFFSHFLLKTASIGRIKK
jgi:hypothetical protein